MSLMDLILFFCYSFCLNFLFLWLDKSYCQVHQPMEKRKVCKCKRCRAFDICPYTVPENVGKRFEK